MICITKTSMYVHELLVIFIHEFIYEKTNSCSFLRSHDVVIDECIMKSQMDSSVDFSHDFMLPYYKVLPQKYLHRFTKSHVVKTP